MTSQLVGTNFLGPEHAAAIQRLASDAAIAATTRIPHPYPENGAQEFIERQLKEREAGSSYVFVIEDRKEFVGLCGLHGVQRDLARELGFWIGRPYWGKGYASFGVKMMLQFAFRNLQLEHIGACSLESNTASRRVLEKNAFRFLRLEPHHDPLLKRPNEFLALYEITRPLWLDSINAPALASLHPPLRSILDAELAAGNEIAETGGGWPDANSIFIRLKHPFRTRPSPLPPGVEYVELNDPHWWIAEYHTLFSPRHLLVY